MPGRRFTCPWGGWKGFDPTLGLLTTTQHVPVAVSRHSEHAMPVTGSFVGRGSAFLKIEVDVRVEEIIPARQFAFRPILQQNQSSYATV
jgi:hypothetical protein